jgi:hypothetical protein
MPKYLPRVIHKYPWWWDEFISKLKKNEIYVKGDKGDPGDKGESSGLASSPPQGCFKIVNFYLDENKNWVIQYDDTPIP